MRYLLNSAVITAPGRYEYRHLTAEEAAEWYRGAADGTYLAAEQAVIEARLAMQAQDASTAPDWPVNERAERAWPADGGDQWRYKPGRWQRLAGHSDPEPLRGLGESFAYASPRNRGGAAQWEPDPSPPPAVAAMVRPAGPRYPELLAAYEAAVARREAAWAAASAPPVSTIGYPETAAALGELLGAAIAVDRRTITMAPGDEALVFRLALPPGSPRIDPADKGRLGREILAGHYELGLLARES